MKHTLVVLVLLAVMMVPGTAAAVDASAGLFGSVNFASLDADFTDTNQDGRTAFGIGGTAEFGLNPYFAISFEPMYLQKGEKVSDIGSPAEITFELATVELPLLFKAYPVEAVARPYVAVGPSLGFFVGHNAKFSDGSTEVDVDVKDILKPTDFSMIFGGGLTFPAGATQLFVDGRYMLGLVDMNEGGTLQVAGQPVVVEDVDVKTRGFQIAGGFRIPIGSW